MNMRLLLDPSVAPTGAAVPAAVPPPAAPAAPAAAAAPAKPAEPAAPAAPSFLAAPAKPAEGAPPAAAPAAVVPAVPEKYDLKVPNGMTMEPAALDKYGAEYKALGCDQAMAQKLLERDLQAHKASHDAVMSQLDAQTKADEGLLRTKWGEKFAERDAKLKVVFDYIDPSGEFRKGLSDARMGYNPLLVGALERLIPLFESPSLKAPSSTGVVESDNRTPREKLTAHYEQRMAAQNGGQKA